MDANSSIELPEPSATVKRTIDDWAPLSLPGGSLVVIEGIDGAGKSTVLGALANALDTDSDDQYTFTTEPDDSTIYGQAVRHAIKDDESHPLSVFFLFLADHANHYQTVVKPALDNDTVVISDRYIDSRYAYQSYALRSSMSNTDMWLDALETYVHETDYPTIRVSDHIADAPPETLFFIALARAFAGGGDLHDSMQEPTTGEGTTVDVASYLTDSGSPLSDVVSQPDEWLSNVRTHDDSLEWIQSIQEYATWSRLPDTTVLIDISVEESFRRKEGDDYETFEKREFLKNVRENYHTLAETEPRFTVIDGEQPPADVVGGMLSALASDVS